MGKIGIIIQREFNQRVRKRAFIITTIITPLLMAAIILMPAILVGARTSGPKTIVVADGSGIIAEKLQSNKFIRYSVSDQSAETLKNELQAGKLGRAFGLLTIGSDIMSNPGNVQLFAGEASTMEIENSVASQIENIIEAEKLKAYDIDDLQQILKETHTDVSLQAFRVDDSGKDKASSSGLAMGLSFVFGLLIYMFILLYGTQVMTGVVEEKSSKVLEIIVSSIKPFQLMMGKIIGIATVALTQFFIWIALIVVFFFIGLEFLAGDTIQQAGAAMMDGGALPAGIDPGVFSTIRSLTDPLFLIKVLGGFVVFFIGGYLLYAAMFAAIGSAVDNVADTQQLQLPVTIPLILAMIIMMNVASDPNSPMAIWFSMIPFTSPIIMMARIPYGVPAWEIILSLVILYATFLLFVWLAGKIYRVGIFMYGKKPTLSEFLKWARYKY